MQSSLSSSTNIRPVTIRQLLDATRPHSDAEFSIDDIVVDHVSIVSHVINIRQYDSCLLYHLDDGTGRIIARQWRSDAVEQLPDDMHVKIHRIASTEIADQIFFHIAETAFVTLCYERGPPPPDALKSAEPQQITAFNSPPVTPSRPTRNSYSYSTPTSPISPPASFYKKANVQTPRSPIPSPLSQSALTSPRTPVSPGREPMQTTAVQSPVPITPIRRSLLRSPDPEPTSSTTRARQTSSSSSSSTYPPPPPITPEQSNRRVSTSSSQSPPVAAASPAQRVTGGSRRRSGIKRDPYEHLTVLQRAILLQILNTSAQEGADSLSIVRGVSHHNATAEQVGDALDRLKAEGLIENTVDSTHYVVKRN